VLRDANRLSRHLGHYREAKPEENGDMSEVAGVVRRAPWLC
jgi:hypothetical protein